MSGMERLYGHTRVPQRAAEVVAEFSHPETDAPMVTWYQTSTLRGEEPTFYSWSKKEFLAAFRPVEGRSQ